MEGRSPLASAPFSLPMTQLPRHPPTVLDGPARRALLSWLWAAAQSDPRRWPPAPPPPMAWSDLATLAEGHGLAAMVLEAAQAQSDPAEALVSQGLARLMDAADRTLTRGWRLATEQATLEKALLRQGLPFAWLKGGWLTEASLYPDPAARPRADLDLFVPETFWPGVAEVLQGLGYRAAQRSWKHAVWLNADHRVVDLRGEHPDNPRTVEVHAWLGEGFRGLRLDLSAEVAPLRPAQHLTRGLALAHLAAHTSVAQLIQQDWARIGVRARIKTYEWGEYLKRANKGEHDVYMSGRSERRRVSAVRWIAWSGRFAATWSCARAARAEAPPASSAISS